MVSAGSPDPDASGRGALGTNKAPVKTGVFCYISIISIAKNRGERGEIQ